MNVYVSLTTVPERLACWDVFKQNLDSLLNQKTTRDYKVVVNIPKIYKNKNIEYIIPQPIQDMANKNPKLILNRIEQDRGPIEKVLGCFNLATNPEDTIVALDDDHVYHEDMLEYIFKKQEQYPEAVIGFRGDTILDKRPFMHNSVPKYVLLGSHAYYPLKHDTHAAVLGHWHSVTYKRRFIEDDIFDDYFMGVAASDDHIMSFYMIEKRREQMICAWDKEDNFIPVNDMAAGIGKGSSHFPIKQQLGFPVADDVGFTVFRRKAGDHIGFIRNDFTKNWIWSTAKVYIQKPYTEADEVAPKVIIPPENCTIKLLNTPIKVNELPDPFVLPTIPPVITLTTIPSRLRAEYEAGIKMCINSLMNQNYPGAYEIHFNIPYTLKHSGEPYVIPQWLKDLQGPKLKIFRTEDYGPITKLYPTIERISDPQTIIVVTDDDLVYHPEMLLEQVKNQYKFDDSAVGYDGIDCWEPIFDDVRDHFITAHRHNFRVKVLQHYKTISYKRSFFDDDFRPFMDEYYEWNDDLLLSAYLGKKHFKRIFTYHEKYTPTLNTLQEWQNGNAAITFPLLGHTSHEGQEGCTIYRMENRPHFKKSPYANLIENFIV